MLRKVDCRFGDDVRYVDRKLWEKIDQSATEWVNEERIQRHKRLDIWKSEHAACVNILETKSRSR